MGMPSRMPSCSRSRKASVCRFLLSISRTATSTGILTPIYYKPTYYSLAAKDIALDRSMIPLGSCTMKYNPKVAERIATYPGFAHLHPLLPQLRMGGMLIRCAGRMDDVEVVAEAGDGAITADHSTAADDTIATHVDPGAAVTLVLEDRLPVSEDERIEVIAMYLESLDRGRRFVELARSTRKPIVVLKGGRSEFGKKASRAFFRILGVR